MSPSGLSPPGKVYSCGMTGVHTYCPVPTKVQPSYRPQRCAGVTASHGGPSGTPAHTVKAQTQCAKITQKSTDLSVLF